MIFKWQHLNRNRSSGASRRFNLTAMHAAKATLVLPIANIRAALSHVNRIAEQLPATNR
jgi:hypothetical protein